MSQYTPEQFRAILEAHAKYLRGEADGARANLYGANLYGANLSGADLSRANLSRANLSRANLSGADLYGANLYGANLSGVDLYGANLYGANLSGANLSGADLSGADLSGADLSGADLSYANLKTVKNADLAIARTRILPEGSLIGWKKCAGNVIVKLSIPEKARRSHAFGRKCRAEFVKVLDILGAKKGQKAISMHDGKTAYTKGRIVKCDLWNEDWTVECGGGIHFYLSRIEAENHS